MVIVASTSPFSRLLDPSMKEVLCPTERSERKVKGGKGEEKEGTLGINEMYRKVIDEESGGPVYGK